MPNVTIRNVPDDVHATLTRRAEAGGQSLQQYLTAELARLAEKPTLEELFARIERRRGGRIGFEDAVTAIQAEREARGT